MVRGVEAPETRLAIPRRRWTRGMEGNGGCQSGGRRFKGIDGERVLGSNFTDGAKAFGASCLTGGRRSQRH